MNPPPFSGGDLRPRVLVTGAGGFVGRHLMPHLAELGFPAQPSDIRLPDRPALVRFLRSFRPDAVVHLAAVTFLPAAERDPARALDTNVEGTRSLVEALRDADPAGGARLVLASSGHVYRPAEEEPLREDSPVDPPTVYGRTKLAAELIARIGCEIEPPRPLVIFRPFNHTGPGQRPEFAAPSFARQVALIEAGRVEPVLWTGDLTVSRDYCDVRDIVRAYALAAAGGVPAGTYNLASGRSASLAQIAEHYRARSRVPLEIRQRIEPGRSGEVRVVRACTARIREACGWRAEISLERTLDDILEEWRARSASGEADP